MAMTSKQFSITLILILVVGGAGIIALFCISPNTTVQEDRFIVFNESSPDYIWSNAYSEGVAGTTTKRILVHETSTQTVWINFHLVIIPEFQLANRFNLETDDLYLKNGSAKIIHGEKYDGSGLFFLVKTDGEWYMPIYVIQYSSGYDFDFILDQLISISD